MVVTTSTAQTIIALKAPMTMEVVRAMVAMVTIQGGRTAFLKIGIWSYTMTSGVMTTSTHAFSLSCGASTIG
jgi:predicted ThiF/HesA family dinucleotide-utilizing enzyme